MFHSNVPSCCSLLRLIRVGFILLNWAENGSGRGGVCVPHRMAGSSDSTDRSIEALNRMKQGSGQHDNMARMDLPVFRFELLLIQRDKSDSYARHFKIFEVVITSFWPQSHDGIKWVRKREVWGGRGRSRCESSRNRAGILIIIMYNNHVRSYQTCRDVPPRT